MEHIIEQVTRIEEDTKALREDGLVEWLKEIRDEQ